MRKLSKKYSMGEEPESLNLPMGQVLPWIVDIRFQRMHSKSWTRSTKACCFRRLPFPIPEKPVEGRPLVLKNEGFAFDPLLDQRLIIAAWDVPKKPDGPEKSEDRGQVETHVTNLFARLLGVAPEEIETDVVFNDYGVSSITLGQVYMDLRERYGPGVKAADIVENNTIDSLTDFILTQTAESSPSLRTSEDCRAVASAKAGPTDYRLPSLPPTLGRLPITDYRSSASATDTTSSSPTSRGRTRPDNGNVR